MDAAARHVAGWTLRPRDRRLALGGYRHSHRWPLPVASRSGLAHDVWRAADARRSRRLVPWSAAGGQPGAWFAARRTGRAVAGPGHAVEPHRLGSNGDRHSRLPGVEELGQGEGRSDGRMELAKEPEESVLLGRRRFDPRTGEWRHLQADGGPRQHRFLRL